MTELTDDDRALGLGRCAQCRHIAPGRSGGWEASSWRCAGRGPNELAGKPLALRFVEISHRCPGFADKSGK